MKHELLLTVDLYRSAGPATLLSTKVGTTVYTVLDLPLILHFGGVGY